MRKNFMKNLLIGMAGLASLIILCPWVFNFINAWAGILLAIAIVLFLINYFYKQFKNLNN
jgi:hypothetical protein